MGIGKLLVSKSEKIIKSLPTDKKASREATKNYGICIEEFKKKYRYVSPTYHKYKPEPVYLD